MKFPLPSANEVYCYLASLLQGLQLPPLVVFIPFILSVLIQTTSRYQERIIRRRVEGDLDLDALDDQDADQVLRSAEKVHAKIQLLISLLLTTVSSLLVALEGYLSLCALLLSLSIAGIIWLFLREDDPNEWRDFSLPFLGRADAVIVLYNVLVILLILM